MAGPAKPLPLAVFCDFDGTFSVQDVGSTIARKHLAERREALWKRLANGELTPWSYNVELFEGFAFGAAELEGFLATIRLDPGARELVTWCSERDVPFRILSDGFDWNLDWLKRRHEIAFEYDANHLELRGDRWSIAPGYPDPTCVCGTGVCKRARIREFRAAHPGRATVHVGNGRVSDLCAALTVDYAFAKDTLAEELNQRGEPFESFETLHDVVAALDRIAADNTGDAARG